MPFMARHRPIIGITVDIEGEQSRLKRSYAELVSRAGGLPIALPCRIECADDYAKLCQGLIFTGGDDPDMAQWGLPTHPQAKAVDPARQAF